MNKFQTLRWLSCCAFILMMAQPSFGAIRVLIAENIYEDVAHAIGGDKITTNVVLSNPQQDPHLFSITPSVAKQSADANVIIMNGGDYDPWILPLLKSAKQKNMIVLNVSALLNNKPGDNPHVWYAPTTMPIVADNLAKIFSQIEPSNRAYFENRLHQYLKHYQVLLEKIKQIKANYPHTNVIATEPIFNDMAKALGFIMHGQAIQISNMNDTSPSITALKNFEDAINSHQIKLFISNKQVNNPLTNRLTQLAIDQHIPVVTVSELQPSNTTFIDWMLMQLETIENALANHETTHDN